MVRSIYVISDYYQAIKQKRRPRAERRKTIASTAVNELQSMTEEQHSDFRSQLRNLFGLSKPGTTGPDCSFSDDKGEEAMIQPETYKPSILWIQIIGE